MVLMCKIGSPGPSIRSSGGAVAGVGNGRTIPLKLRLGKKSGRYDLSQDVYVLAVNIGDKPVIQCTLSTESTARECIEYIQQKRGLQQIHMFGLRFQMRSQDPDERIFRWVEMDRPLRKQLEKWGCKPRQVQLAVLYHTPNPFILTDPMARSYYFLLMKLDVVEGRLTMDMENYIGLAAHSLQAEYGDYDKESMTIDYMQTIPLLPKQICRSATILESLLMKVLQLYETLRGMSCDKAAILYIVGVIHCEGYGEEYFKAKDEDSSEVKLGYSPKGIVVKVYGAPVKYEWEKVKGFAAHKRHLQIKTRDLVVEYSLEDAEWARYVCMVLEWQLHYATHKAPEERDVENDITDLQPKSSHLNASQVDLLHARRASSSINIHSTHSLHKPSSTSLTNVHSVNNHDKNRPILSSVSFRDPVTVSVTPERPRAATAAILPSPLSSTYSNNTGSQSQLMQMAPLGIPSSIQEIPQDAFPTWHRNIIEDRNAAYKAYLPNAVEIEPLKPFVSAVRAKDGVQRKILGSTPEMRQLGTRMEGNHEQLLKFMMAQDPPRPSFQSTPNLMDVRLQPGMGTFMGMWIPPEPPQIAPQSRQSGSRPRLATATRVLPHQDSSETQATIESNASSQMRLYEEASQPGTSRQMGINMEHREFHGEAKGALALLIEKKLLGPMDALSREFLLIPNKRITAGTATSSKPENLNKNRTRSILPYEDNRVVLQSHKKNSTGYVNASNVEVPLNGQKLHYILAQAPMRGTVDDFWATIWESNVNVVVMLCEATIEAGPNAPIYWPGNSNSKVETRDLEVRFKSLSAAENEVTTVLQLRHKNGSKRTVYHMRFVGWPTGGTPREGPLLAFMDSVSAMQRNVTARDSCKINVERATSPESGSPLKRQKSEDLSIWRRRLNSLSIINIGHSTNSSESSSDSGAPPSPGKNCDVDENSAHSPLLIHCYSGSHESGVYLLADVLIYCAEHNLPVDIPGLLGNLRAQRMSLVKTVEQYSFVYSLLHAYLNRSRLI